MFIPSSIFYNMQLHHIPNKNKKQLAFCLVMALVRYPSLTSGLPMVSSEPKLIDDGLGTNDASQTGVREINQVPNCIPKGTKNATPVHTASSSQQTNGNTVTTKYESHDSSASSTSSDPNSGNGLRCEETIERSTSSETSSSSTTEKSENPFKSTGPPSTDIGKDIFNFADDLESDLLGPNSPEGLLTSLGNQLGEEGVNQIGLTEPNSSFSNELGGEGLNELGLNTSMSSNSTTSTSGGTPAKSQFYQSSTSTGGDGIKDTSLLDTTSMPHGTGRNTGKSSGDSLTNSENTKDIWMD